MKTTRISFRETMKNYKEIRRKERIKTLLIGGLGLLTTMVITVAINNAELKIDKEA